MILEMWMSVRNMYQLSAVIVAIKTQNQYCYNICTFGICKEGPIALTELQNPFSSRCCYHYNAAKINGV